jgi:hypothetical protein
MCIPAQVDEKRFQQIIYNVIASALLYTLSVTNRYV